MYSILVIRFILSTIYGKISLQKVQHACQNYKIYCQFKFTEKARNSNVIFKKMSIEMDVQKKTSSKK